MPFSLDAGAVPQDLAARKQWLVWRYENKPGQAKPAKMPYYVSGRKRAGTQGSDADRAALETLDIALKKAASGNWGGIGFAFLPGDGLIGIDLDRVIEAEGGKIKQGAQRIIDSCASYTEYSPSGTGVHIIVRGELEKVEKDNGIGVEIFAGRQYFTFTAKLFPGAPATVNQIDPTVLQRLLQLVIDAKAKKKGRVPERSSASAPPAAIPDAQAKVRSALAYITPDLNYDDWIAVGGAIYAELGSGAFDVYDQWSAGGKKYGGSEATRKHWDSFSKFSGGSGALFRKAMDGGWRALAIGKKAGKPARKSASKAPDKPAPKGVSTPSGPHGGSGPPDAPGGPPPGPPEDEDAWRNALLWKKGYLIACRENVLLILRDHPDWRGVLGVDTFAKRIMVRKPSPLGHEAGDEWGENDHIELGLWLAQQEGLVISSIDAIAGAVAYVARLAKFHPVLEYFETLEWDREARLTHWAHELLGTRDGEYERIVGELFLINMVRRIFEPGCVMRSVPVLEGEQNRGKSTALRLLAQPWFSDSMFRVGDKDAYMAIQGVMLYEISELDSFTKAEASAVKAFVSSVRDKFRAPYERAMEDHERQTTFAATCNGAEYLKDFSGNTRFWPLECAVAGDIRLDLIEQHRDQLLAEAITRYKNGAPTFPNPDQVNRLFKPEQDQRMVVHPWRQKLVKYLDVTGDKAFMVSDLLKDALHVDLSRIGPQGVESQTVGKIMQSLGWKKWRDPSDMEWKWRRPDAAPKSEAAATKSDIPEEKGDYVDPF
jgi:predicted P-loop ATPase